MNRRCRPFPIRLPAAGLAAGLLACAAQAIAQPLTISVDELNLPADAVSTVVPADPSVVGESSAAGAVACEPAIAAAATAHEVPAELLLAIGMVESGLTPWVLNAEGTPYFFDAAAEAAAEVDRLRAGGVESIDVGCMQINLRWHPTAFPDSTTAFDPLANANYAAEFLLSLFGMTGSWTDAVAYYHSSAQRYQRPYVCAVAARLEEMGSSMSLECLPSDELDLPQVASSAPSSIAVAPSSVPDESPHMLRIAPSSGSGPAVVRGQGAQSEAGDATGPGLDGGPRVIRVR